MKLAGQTPDKHTDTLPKSLGKLQPMLLQLDVLLA